MRHKSSLADTQTISQKLKGKAAPIALALSAVFGAVVLSNFKEQQTPIHVYDSQEACISEGVFASAVCTSAFERAAAMATSYAGYASLKACAMHWSLPQCTPNEVGLNAQDNEASAGDQSSRMIGYRPFWEGRYAVNAAEAAVPVYPVRQFGTDEIIAYALQSGARISIEPSNRSASVTQAAFVAAQSYAPYIVLAASAVPLLNNNAKATGCTMGRTVGMSPKRVRRKAREYQSCVNMENRRRRRDLQNAL